MAFFDSIYSLPVHRDYKTWAKWHDDTKPIRGRSPELRPLARRQDCDKYSIRKREDGAIELVLYSTPVVTWCPDDSVEIWFGRWSSTMTCHFINRLVPAVRDASSRNEGLALWLDNGEVRVMQKDERLIFDFTQGRMVPREQAQTRYRLGIDRKQANIVRREYADFIQFAKAMMGLLKGMDGSDVVNVSDRFFMDNGYVTYHARTNEHVWVTHSPEVPRDVATHYRLKLKAQPHLDLFLRLAKSEDYNERNQAMCILFSNSNMTSRMWGVAAENLLEDVGNHALRVNMTHAQATLDEMLLRANAKRVLVRKKVRPDQLTGTKYFDWLDKSELDNLPIK